MSTTEDQFAPTEQPAIEAPITPAPAMPAEVKPADPTDRRELIKQAFEKPATDRGKHAQFQPREERGKFAEGPPQFPVPQRPPRPASLKKDIEPHWNTAPVELLQEIVRREADHEKGIIPLKQRAAEAEELLNEFKPYEWILRNENATPRQAIGSLLQTAAILRTGTPAQKAQSVAQVMQQFGIPLAHIQQLFGTPQGSPQAALDHPQLNALTQQVQQLHEQLSASQIRQQQQIEAQATKAIEKFASDPAHPHYEAVQDRMLQLLQSPSVLGLSEDASHEEKLQTAYDAAIRLDPALSSQVTPQAVTQVQKSRAAAVQVKGAPASGPAPAINPNDRRALIANAFQRAR